MKARFLGTSPCHNAILGMVLPDEVYDIPADLEAAIAQNGEWEIVKKKKSNGE